VAAVPGKDTGELALAGGVSGTTAADGKAVFTGVGGCSGCHTLAAASATGTVGPDLDTRLRSDCASSASEKIRGTTLEDCIRTAITKPYAFIPSGYAAGVMPANFAKSLTPAEITALVNFLSTAAK
jgi:cytochrome c oxidase subunit 2